MNDELGSLLDYLRWADLHMIDALRKLSPEQYAAEPAPGWSSLRATLAHMGDAMDIWARRLAGESPAVRRTEGDVPTLGDAETLLAHGHAALVARLAEFSPEALDEVWTYRNMAGEAASLPRREVFRHVVNHGTYHRGQVASKIRLLGGLPPATDLIYWAVERSAPQGYGD